MFSEQDVIHFDTNNNRNTSGGASHDPKGGSAVKKALKIIGIVAAVVVVIIIGLTIFVKSYLTDARIRTIITQTAESSLHRKVSLGAISVSIFSGISVKDFEIKERGSNSDFLKADAFVLKYRLMPLLSRRLVIDRLGIESPSIVIRKSADGSFNFSDMTGRKGGAAPEGEGTGGSPGLPVSLNVQSLRIERGQLQYYDPSGKLKKALIGFDATMSIEGRSTDVIDSSGELNLKLTELVLKDRPAPLRNIPVALRYGAEVDLAKKKLELRQASVEAMGIPATIKGEVNYSEPLSYTIDVSAKSVDLAAVQKAAADFLPPGMVISGLMSLKVAAEQRPVKDSKPVFNGEVTLDKVSVKVKDMQPVFSGTVSLTPDLIELKKMRLVAGDSSASVKGSISHYSSAPDIHIDVSSNMLNLDSIIPPSGKGEAGPGTSRKSEEKEFGPLKSRITAGGDVSIAKMLYKGITIRNLKGHYTFRNNVFTLASLTGNTLSGSFTAKSTVDLSKKGTTYSLNAATDGIKLEDIASAFAPKAKGILFGSLSARADMSGAGSVSATIKRNLKGKGTFNVKNGEIKNAPISDGLLSILGLQSLKEIPMEKAEGAFSISGGVIDLRSIIASKDLQLDETGTIGMDQKLNMGVLVKVSDRLSPKLLAQSGVSQFLTGEKGWTTIPLKLTGTISRPSYGVDTQAVGKRATQTIRKKVKEEIFKALSGNKKKSEQPAGTPGKGSSPQDLFKGLFK